MANQKIRIKLKAYEHSIIDQSAARIVETAKRLPEHTKKRCNNEKGNSRQEDRYDPDFRR